MFQNLLLDKHQTIQSRLPQFKAMFVKQVKFTWYFENPLIDRWATLSTSTSGLGFNICLEVLFLFQRLNVSSCFRFLWLFMKIIPCGISVCPPICLLLFSSMNHVCEIIWIIANNLQTKIYWIVHYKRKKWFKKVKSQFLL